MTTFLPPPSSFSMFFPLDDEVFEKEIEKDWEEYRTTLIDSPSNQPPDIDPTLNQHHNHPDHHYPPLLIFDWDDTLFPTSDVMDNIHPQVHIASDGTIIDIIDNDKNAAEFNEKIKALEKTLSDLLNHASQRGVVFIVTNSQTGWVHTSVEKYLPSMVAMIKSIPVISAHDIYAAKSPKPNPDLEPDKFNAWLSDAKKWAMLNVVEQRRHRKVVSIGDGLSERSAVLDLSRETGVTACSIKMCDRPTTELLIVQQKYLMGILDDVINRRDTIDLKIKVNLK